MLDSLGPEERVLAVLSVVRQRAVRGSTLPEGATEQDAAAIERRTKERMERVAAVGRASSYDRDKPDPKAADDLVRALLELSADW
jgi:hypothetical protein